MRLKFNSLKSRLRTQDYVLGTFLEIPSPQLVELLGLAGFDFFIVDREHGSIDLAQCEELIRASLSTDISPMVRVSSADEVIVRQPLDMGAAGIHVPQVNSLDAANTALRGALFHPVGERGLQPFVRAASYRSYGAAEFFREANSEVVTVFHIEGRRGVEALDGILALEGLDVVFIGPYDLSQSLGVPGQVKHPAVREKMLEVIEKTRTSGKVVGTYCDDAAAALEWKALGVRYLAVSIDAALFLTGARDMVSAIREAK
jgi:4-hydroxy-2-oxoheptanedioate aldolase